MQDGHGYTVLPRTSLRGFGMERAFSVLPIVRPRVSIRLSLVVSSRRSMTPLARGVLKLIREIGSGALSARRGASRKR